MEQLFRVAIHYLNDCGYIEYDPVARKINVVLDNPAKRAEMEAYLGKEQVIRTVRNGLRDFAESRVMPADSLAIFQIVLTHLWHNTGVLVDWSRPVPN